MDRIIEIKVNGSHLTKDNRIAGVQHEGNAKTLRIEFDEGWDGYAKKVTFWDATGANPVERTLTADLLEDITESIRIYLCKIPPEPMAEAGEFTFVIDGYTDGVRQRSISDTMVVKPAPFIEKADEPTDPTPSQAEQLQVQIDTLLGDMQEQAQIAVENAAIAVEKAGEASNSASSAANSEAAANEYRQMAYQYMVDSSANASSAGNSAAAAEEARSAIENMTVSSTTLAAGAQASVTKTTKDGVVNLHFGIPKGKDGSGGSGGGGGTGDMSAGTYDPTGKKQDIFAYADKAASNAATQAAQKAAADVAANVESAASKAATAAAKTAAEQAVANADVKKHASRHAKNGADPIAPADIGAAPDDHTHTATEVGAVPTTGGSMTGNLSVHSANAQVILHNTNTNRYAVTLADSNGCASLGTHVDANNIQQLKVRPETYELQKALQLLRVVNGEQTWYNVLHTGNLAEMGVGQMAYGSYVGTGTKGVDAPNVVTLPFAADVFIMLTRTYLTKQSKPRVEALWGIGDQGGTTTANYICALPLAELGTDYPANYDLSTDMPKMFGHYGETGDYSIAKKSANGKTITWCHERSAACQFNTSGSTYYWMAIKF